MASSAIAGLAMPYFGGRKHEQASKPLRLIHFTDLQMSAISVRATGQRVTMYRVF